ncbi:DUF2017 domain-containing protein [Nostocoides vanveenii]|uniref:DUF2017 domain-containing protein n=1 Tax=Nostocoides vanveenii TaxID=330835 RepID=A0ABN2L2H4_9MICO
MARAFTVRGKGADLRYAARLDQAERAVLVQLFEQVVTLIGPPADSAQPGGGDEFDAIVAGLGSDFGSVTVPDSPASLGGRGLPEHPRDPALDRLFPAGNRTDAEAAREFRRLTEPTLRSRKVDNLRTAIAALTHAVDERVELDAPTALAFLVALTDVRLVVGDRLGLRDDEDARRLDAVAQAADPDDPAAYAIVVYDFLTWLQETLATSMLPRAGR